jgi:(p)ppGpp synthase/HD superfamily hydrolase
VRASERYRCHIGNAGDPRDRSPLAVTIVIIPSYQLPPTMTDASASLPPGLLLKRALDHAAVLHVDQARKYPGVRVPYMSHLAGVVSILARHGLPEDVQAAGALHDALEDTAATYEDLRVRFGARVAELVRWSSEEDKTLPWEERKRRYVERFPSKPWEAQAITLADKIDNLRSIVVCALDHGDPWAQFKRGRAAQLERFDALLAAAWALPHPLPRALVEEYAQALAEARRVGDDGHVRDDGVDGD